MSFTFEKLGAVCSINPRLPKDSNESQEVSFLSMSSVSEGGKILDQETRVLSETKKGFTYFEREDILLAKITPCFENGKAVLTSNLKNLIGYGSTEFHVLRPIPEIANGKYLFYLVWNDSFRHHGQHAMKGAAGQKRISTDFLKNFKIPLPPLAEQQKIAAILEAADQLRQKDQQLIEKHTALSQSLFLEMFGDPVINPMGWDKRILKDMGVVYTGNTPPRANPEYYGDDIEWIKTNNINTPNMYLTLAEESLSNSGLNVGRSVDANSLLVTCIAGSKKVIGNVAIANRKVAFNQQINSFTPSDGSILYFYYLFIVGKKHVQSFSTNSMKGMINKSKFESIDFIAPPITLQNQFADHIQAIEAQKQQAELSLQKSNDLFNSLLQRAFKGELTT